MTLDAIKQAIADLPPEDRAALAAWIAEREMDQWDRQMQRDFSPGNGSVSDIIVPRRTQLSASGTLFGPHGHWCPKEPIHSLRQQMAKSQFLPLQAKSTLAHSWSHAQDASLPGSCCRKRSRLRPHCPYATFSAAARNSS